MFRLPERERRGGGEGSKGNQKGLKYKKMSITGVKISKSYHMKSVSINITMLGVF